jgi:DNA-binding transcriptional LysR family regulator
MTLWQLQTFATVAREGSFTKAGKTLHIAQPSVSALVIGLQKELEIKLFEKLGMKPHLTEAGRRVLLLVERALAIIEKIPEEIEEVKGLKKGRIRIGGTVLAASSFLPAAVQSFKKEHSGIDVIYKTDRSRELERMLLEGELDLAITMSPSRSPRLTSEPFREEKMVVIAPPKHPLARKRSVPLQALAKEPLITFEKGTILRDVIEQKFADKGLSIVPALQADFKLGGIHTIQNAVASGLGIGLLGECHVIGDLKAGRLKILNISDLRLRLKMYLTVRKHQENPLGLKELVEFLKRNYKE